MPPRAPRRVSVVGVGVVLEVDFAVHGEASSVRNLRRHLVAERGLDPARMSISGYWKRKRTEEGWREDKAEWARLVEADLVAAS